MNRQNTQRFAAVLLALLLYAGLAFGQSAPPEIRQMSLESKLNARKMPYRVILPPGYAAKENALKRYPVIFLLHGLTGHYDNWTDRTKLAQYAAKYSFIIVTPEGDDGWYTDSQTRPNDKYESYIMKELVPEVDAKFRTAAERRSRAIAGLSMGGYGALKFGLKYPETFVLAGSFSGALSVATDGWSIEFLRPSLVNVYGTKDSQTVKDNDIYAMIRNVSPEKVKDLPFLYIDCGTEDFLIASNRDLVTLLMEKKVPHEYRQLPGKHDWKYWDRQVQEFLQVAERAFAAGATAAK